MAPLKVIALISGGKDSLFSILHCMSHGHQTVALANLYPPPPATDPDHQGEAEDLNSFMYQTVGHSIIPLYEEALGIPLYRQQILGSAVNSDRDYAAPTETNDESDETESLIPLLRKVIEEHPEANAVSTGAILSTYQRTRVESVATRLGLTPLSYLWQYTSLPPYMQSALLEDMAQVAQDARIIKVASGGLDESFLWENVADAKTIRRLKKAMSRFGEPGDGAVVGEGGEFETLAVDGPGVLWKKRIEVETGESINGEGGSAVVRLVAGRVMEKEGDGGGLEMLRRPRMLDDEFGEVLDTLRRDAILGMYARSESTTDRTTAQSTVVLPPSATITESPDLLSISNLSAPDAGPSATGQMSSIIASLRLILIRHDLPPSSITFTTILLRSMSSFTSINPIYGSLFTTPNPPSRATVACGSSLPEGVEVLLSVVVDKTGSRRGLHVQSRSYWAPANIGPYSQAISTPIRDVVDGDGDVEGDGKEGARAVYVAGQIPLIPRSMEPVGPADLGEGVQEGEEVEVEVFKMQAVLSLQHLWRIGRVVGVDCWTPGIAFLSESSAKEGDLRAATAIRTWRNIIHTSMLSTIGDDDGDGSDEGIDVWDLKHGLSKALDTVAVDGDWRPKLPDPQALVRGARDDIPPTFVVQVGELPRGVDIEWTSIGLANAKVAVHHETAELDVHITKVIGTDTSFLSVGLGNMEELKDLKALLKDMYEDARLEDSDKAGQGFRWEHAAFYTTQALPDKLEEWLGMMPQIVPCKRVWGGEDVPCELAAVLIIRHTRISPSS